MLSAHAHSARLRDGGAKFRILASGAGGSFGVPRSTKAQFEFEPSFRASGGASGRKTQVEFEASFRASAGACASVCRAAAARSRRKDTSGAG
jgi:hypothetical protein